MSEEYFEKARELANMLLLSLESQTLNNARRVFENSESAQDMLSEYNSYQNEIREKYQRDELSEGELNEATEKLQAMFKELKKDSVVGPLIFAETQFNNLISQVMDIFKSTLTGKPSDGCGGSCGGCDGCN